MACPDLQSRCATSLVPYRDFDYPRLVSTPGKGNWISGTEYFFVEEIPLYPFAGEGEHSALVVRKRDISTRDLALKVAAALNLEPSAVGYGGMKDKDATAVQAFTLYRADEQKAAAAFLEAGAEILSVSRHANKLRLGHLAGNRFKVFIAGGDIEMARNSLTALFDCGVPNFFGPQRFGVEGKNIEDGLRVLKGFGKFGRWKRDLLVSSVQSLLFNEILARRMEEGVLGAALPGDVMQKTDSGGLFVCEDPEVDSRRLTMKAVVPTGPIFGRKMKQPAGAPAQAEKQVLADFGLPEDLFRRENGTRRALAFHLEDPKVEEGEGGIWLHFVCPPGCYATSVIREVAESGVLRK